MNAQAPVKPQRKKELLFILLLCVSLGICWLIIDFLTGGSTSKRESQLHAALHQALYSQADRIKLSDLTSFPWTKVCAVPAYASKELVERKLEFNWPGYDAVQWWGHDGYWTLLFVSPAQEVIPIRIPRVDIGDMPTKEAYHRPCLPPDSAILVVEPPHAAKGRGRQLRFL